MSGAPPAMSKDPVCGVDVDESTARAAGRMSEYQGKTYFLISTNANRTSTKSRKAM